MTLTFYNINWYNELTKQGSISATKSVIQEPDPKELPELNNASSFDKVASINLINYHLIILRSTDLVYLNGYLKINHNLLETLRKEYHLK